MLRSMDIDSQLLAELRAAAHSASHMHYGPYSGFCVLAALEVISEDGTRRVCGGSNVENVAFNPSVHAEQSALIVARSTWDGPVPQRIVSAVYVASIGGGAPCGHCRQFLSEFAREGCIWIAEDTEAQTIRSGLFADLLPEAFITYQNQ